MSKFLGPIHYWLYGKIGNQEELTRCLAEAALRDGKLADIDTYVRDLPPLETVIDEGNIHGWLQTRIADAEQRYASFVLALTTKEPDYLDVLVRNAYSFGTQHALSEGTTPAEAYKAFEDFFVNGMPCDHVNLVTESTDQTLSWTQTRDLHEDAWSAQGGDVSIYYQLRKSVMDGMLSRSGLALSMPDSDHYTIRLA
jgi:hypothetical protein